MISASRMKYWRRASTENDLAHAAGRFLRVILLADRERFTMRSLTRVRAMKTRYFAETDTLHIDFRNVPVVETRDLDENTLLDVEAEGHISAITVEHASERAGIPAFSYEQVTA